MSSTASAPVKPGKPAQKSFGQSQPENWINSTRSKCSMNCAYRQVIGWSNSQESVKANIVFESIISIGFVSRGQAQAQI